MAQNCVQSNNEAGDLDDAVTFSEKSIATSIGVKNNSSTVVLPTSVPKHIRNTYKMISELTEKCPDVASWNDDGTFFSINDKKRFVSKMPEYGFGMNKFDNFVKQQNNYGFERVYSQNELRGGNEGQGQSGLYRVAFKHKNFLRDDPSLCGLIVSKSRVGKRLSKISLNNNCNGSNDDETGITVADLKKQIDDLKRHVHSLQDEKSSMEKSYIGRLGSAVKTSSDQLSFEVRA